MKKIKYIILFLFFIVQASGQRLSPEIKALVHKIEKYNELDAESVGYSLIKTDQYRSFEKLRDKATMEELLYILKNKNPVAKGYASWALADRKYPKLEDVFTEFLRTKEIVNTQNGCIGLEIDLATVFYDRVAYQRFYNKLSLDDSLFFQSKIQLLDSVLLYREAPHDLLTQALSNNNGNAKTYAKIRFWALTEKNTYAIRALGIYQRKEDIEDIKNLREEGFIAIEQFPHNEFWEFLLSFKEKNQSERYLSAVAAFKTETSAKVLFEILPKITGGYIEPFCAAITKNYCTFYQGLIIAVWKQYNTIDAGAAKYLIKDAPEKAASAFLNGLLSNEKLKFINCEYNYDIDASGEILPLMLNHIKVYQNKDILNICEQNIKSAKLTTLAHFLKCATDNRLTEANDEVLDRLQEDNTAYEIFHLTETALAFNKPENKEKIKMILKSKQEDWDWGNWSEGFRELFAKYNFKLN